MNTAHDHDPRRTTLGWLATLAGGSLLVLFGTTGCASTSADDSDGGDIEVHVPLQSEANATASKVITADNADDELDKLDDEVGADEN